MQMQEIFDALVRHAMDKHQHPDPVARVYAGLQDLNQMFFDWGIKEREKHRGGDQIG